MNKCKDCEHSFTYVPIGKGNIYQACKLDDKVVNAYGCDGELPGNNAEEIPNYPVDDLTN